MNNPRDEWRVEVRDWWYSLQDLGLEIPESKRVEIEKIVKKALDYQRNRDLEVVEGLEEIFPPAYSGITALVKNEIRDRINNQDK